MINSSETDQKCHYSSNAVAPTDRQECPHLRAQYQAFLHKQNIWLNQAHQLYHSIPVLSGLNSLPAMFKVQLNLNHQQQWEGNSNMMDIRYDSQTETEGVAANKTAVYTCPSPSPSATTTSLARGEMQ